MERKLFVEALRRLDPSRPADDAQVTARPGWDRFDEVLLQLEAGTRVRYALHGSVGVGKTTELLLWKRRLEQIGFRAEYVAIPPRASLGDLVSHRLEHIGKNFQLLLIDGLDLQPERADEWFGPGSPLVDPKLPALVAVAPHLVGRWPPDRRDPRLQLLQLLPFPVLERTGRAGWNAVKALADLLAKRLYGLEVLERETLPGRVALMSGGVPRDAVRILRAAVLSAASRGTTISLRDVVQGERELRQDFEQAFLPDDTATLREVARTHKFQAPDPRLLTMGAVLLYEDDIGSYASPHPVLMATIGVDQDLAVDAAVAGNVP